ncbi:MAG: hypothetical protein IT240_09210, partial [Bacteroidia bacterium]|nr:hypothetical protein [Bacteroidia bacterium]
RLINLSKGESIAAVARVDKDDEMEEGEGDVENQGEQGENAVEPENE